MTYLVVCDGPDPASASCSAVDASGLLVVGQGALTTTELGAILGGITLLFGLAYVVRLILRTMGFR